MANLDGTTTNGQSSWDKYVKQNKNWRDLNLEAEIDSELYKKSQTKLVEILSFQKGTSIKLKSNLVTTISNKKYANVTINRKDGFISLKAIRKPTNFAPTAYEADVVNLINAHISKNNNIPIDIYIRGLNKTYKRIAGAIQVDTQIKRKGGVSSDPKADIILYSDKNNLLSINNIFISHKKEGGPEAFLQYGGITEKAGTEIYSHPETKKFLKAVAKNIDPKEGLKSPMFMKIKDSRLKNLSIFGPNFDKAYGLQHVQLIGQGSPKLIPTKKENVYELEFSTPISVSGDLSHFTEGYMPVFGARYAAGRGFELDGKRYDGARVGIFPTKLITGRGGVIEVK